MMIRLDRNGAPRVRLKAKRSGDSGRAARQRPLFRACSPRRSLRTRRKKAAMAHIVDFLQSQPPDVYRFVLNAIEPLWLEPMADATVRQAIKQQFPGKFSEDEIGLLIHGAMFIMK
jgi:hypothetical protein